MNDATQAGILGRTSACCPPGCLSTDHDDERSGPGDSSYVHRAVAGQDADHRWLVEVQICEPFDDDAVPGPATVFTEIPDSVTMDADTSAAIGAAITAGSILAREWTEFFLGVPPVRPQDVVCPDWCRYSPEWHVQELDDLEGQCVHAGEVGGAYLLLTTWPDGSPTQDAPTITVDGGAQHLTAAKAISMAASLLAGVEALNHQRASR